MLLRPRVLWLVAAGACSSGGGDTPTPPPPKTAVAIDAGIDAIDVMPTRDPNDGFHVDETDPADAVRPNPRKRARGPMVTLVLRSSPPGAQAAVDNEALGRTPVVWQGASLAEYEFTFTLPGHSVGRYKFVPLRDGVVHGTLVRQQHPPGAPGTTGTTANAAGTAATPPATVAPPTTPTTPVAPPVTPAAPPIDAPPPPPSPLDLIDAGFPPVVPAVPIDAP